MRPKLGFAIALLASCIFPALAQNSAPPAAPTRIYGTVESFSGQTLVVKSQNGEEVSVSVPAQSKIISIRLGSLAEIKPGDFVGSAAVQGEDGKLHAQEVHIFSESMRGTGEGHRPMGPDPNRTMTNGTVTATPNASEGRTMTNGTVSQVNGAAQTRTLAVTYKGGEQAIEVGSDVPIRYYVPADASLLKPGATVSVIATQKDGALVATIVQAEKDGIKPPRP
jgi:hypothetical protein